MNISRLKEKVRLNLQLFYPLASILWLKRIHIMDTKETINHILKNECSVSRFGDGEFNMIQGRGNGFQQYHPKLAKRLKEILMTNSSEKHIVCIPQTFICTEGYKPYPKKFWRFYAVRHFCFLLKYISPSFQYFDSLMSRFYIDRENRSESFIYIERLKKIWKRRNIIIVEGDKTHSGIGNDLFAEALSIRRILAPSKNAFNSYENILAAIKQYANLDDLILLSLGMTATVLSFDLHKLGYQAIDLGHLDIEYEWFNQKATKKTALPGRYVNEVVGGDEVASCNEPEFRKQIVCIVTNSR